jgi:two-component system, chemotaxis family, protein-glutamate methylesterase/glutaminase
MDIPRLIVIGSSAGGIEALITLVSALPEHFATSICIAQHLSPLKESVLPVILTRLERLPASHPHDGARLVGDTIFVAPPAHHLSVTGEQVVVTPVVRERSSPSVDRLFASAANSYGSGVIGIILTGLLRDGTVGLQAVKHAGGITIIQDPLSAAYPSMPQSAQDHCAIDYCLDLAQIASLLQTLAG